VPTIPDPASLQEQVTRLEAENSWLSQTVATLWYRLEYVISVMGEMNREAGMGELPALAVNSSPPARPVHRLSVVR
jgi:hypothetical protein